MLSAGREKSYGISKAPVPQTDSGRRGEEPQAIERTLLKELGKIAAVS